MAKNTNRYHIGKNGLPAACQAKKRMCPLGGEEVHFASKEEAEEYAEKTNMKKYGLFHGNKSKNDDPPKTKGKSVKSAFRERKDSFSEGLHMNTKITHWTSGRERGEKSYLHKIKSISVFNENIRKGIKSVHYSEEREKREERIHERIGVGTPVNRFLICDRSTNPQIHEIYDNGKIKVYDSNNHKQITIFVPKWERLEDVYEKIGIEPPKGLIERAKINTERGYNAI